MKISIITIVYNDKHHICRTINNILSQTARNSIEYIVVNGASTDGTTELISQYGDDIDINICEPDTGIYNAMNKGLRVASGDYVMFINSGDRLDDKKTIEYIIDAIGPNRPKVVYGHYRECKSNVLSSIIPCRSYTKIWYGPVASHQSMLYLLKHIRGNCLWYDESYRIAADYKFTAEAITKAGSDILQLDLCISDFDVAGVSSTNQNLGLTEANRVRREVFGWNGFKIALITILLIGARYTKKYLKPLYKLLRY